MSKVEELRGKIILLINETHQANIGDKIYDNKKPERIGVITEIRPERWSSHRVKWDDGKEENHCIRDGGTPYISCNYCLLSSKDEINACWKEIGDIESAIGRLNWKQFISDIKRDMSDADLKIRHKLTDDEYEAIIDSPHLKYAFS